MQPSRLFLALFLLVQAVLAACGGGGGSAGTEPGSGDTTGGTDTPGTTAATETTADVGAGSGGVGNADNGTIRFKISGNWEKEGEMVFIPEGSMYIDNAWSLSFTPDRDGSGDAIITINLNPEVMVVTYGDPEFTVVGGKD